MNSSDAPALAVVVAVVLTTLNILPEPPTLPVAHAPMPYNVDDPARTFKPTYIMRASTAHAQGHRPNLPSKPTVALRCRRPEPGCHVRCRCPRDAVIATRGSPYPGCIILAACPFVVGAGSVGRRFHWGTLLGLALCRPRMVAPRRRNGGSECPRHRPALAAVLGSLVACPTRVQPKHG
jgi:hypothetical protein